MMMRRLYNRIYYVWLDPTNLPPQKIDHKRCRNSTITQQGDMKVSEYFTLFCFTEMCRLEESRGGGGT